MTKENNSWKLWILNIVASILILLSSGILVYVLGKVEANATELSKVKTLQAQMETEQEITYIYIKESLNDIKCKLEVLSNKVDSLKLR